MILSSTRSMIPAASATVIARAALRLLTSTRLANSLTVSEQVLFEDLYASSRIAPKTFNCKAESVNVARRDIDRRTNSFCIVSFEVSFIADIAVVLHYGTYPFL